MTMRLRSTDVSSGPQFPRFQNVEPTMADVCALTDEQHVHDAATVAARQLGRGGAVWCTVLINGVVNSVPLTLRN